MPTVFGILYCTLIDVTTNARFVRFMTETKKNNNNCIRLWEVWAVSFFKYEFIDRTLFCLFEM